MLKKRSLLCFAFLCFALLCIALRLGEKLLSGFLAKSAKGSAKECGHILYNGPVSEPNEAMPKEPGRVALLALLVGVLSILGFPLYEVKEPPGSPAPQLTQWALSYTTIGLALVASKRSASLSPRIVGGIAILLALVSNLGATFSWTLSHHSDPLPFLALLTGAVGAGGWLCHQKMIAGGSVCLCGLAIVTALLPGQRQSTVQRAGIRATLEGVGKGDFEVRLASADATPLRENVDVRLIRVSACAGSFLPVRARPIFTMGEIGEQVPRTDTFSQSTSTAMPSWTRSGNVGLVVQKWPPKPLLTTRLVLDSLPKGNVELRNGTAWMELDDIKLGMSTITRTGALTMSMRGHSLGHPRLRDDRGRDLELGSGGAFYRGESRFERWEFLGVTADTKWVQIDVFSSDQLAEHRMEFQFNRMSVR
jgi:hypothetical protein